MQVVDFVMTVLSSAAVSTSLSLALVFLLRSWITERLRQSIAHEYALQLESHRATLKAEQEVALERLRADNAQQIAIQAAAINSFAEGHKAAHERRLEAISMIWQAVLTLRRDAPPVLFMQGKRSQE